MKLFTTFALFVMALANSASATGLSRVVYDCKDGSGEAAASVKITHVTHTAPGVVTSDYHTGQASHSWLGGTHDTGSVVVKKIVAEDGGPTSWINAEKSFYLHVHKVDYVNRSLIVKRIDVSGDFVGTDKMKFSIGRRWLTCKKAN